MPAAVSGNCRVPACLSTTTCCPDPEPPHPSMVVFLVLRSFPFYHSAAWHSGYADNEYPVQKQDTATRTHTLTSELSKALCTQLLCCLVRIVG